MSEETYEGFTIQNKQIVLADHIIPYYEVIGKGFPVFMTIDVQDAMVIIDRLIKRECPYDYTFKDTMEQFQYLEEIIHDDIIIKHLYVLEGLFNAYLVKYEGAKKTLKDVSDYYGEAICRLREIIYKLKNGIATTDDDYKEVPICFRLTEDKTNSKK